VREDTPFTVAGIWENLPDRTRLYGRLYFGEKRVYGFFTEARTTTGETYPVCMRLYLEGEPGTPVQPGSTPENMLVGPVAKVEVMDHFE
jgi:serine/threonine-protein kinase